MFVSTFLTCLGSAFLLFGGLNILISRESYTLKKYIPLIILGLFLNLSACTWDYLEKKVLLETKTIELNPINDLETSYED